VELGLTEEQDALRDAVTRVLDEHCTPARVRVVEAATGFDAELWRELGAMGLPAMLAAPPAGSGATLVDAMVVCEAAGRALAAVPLSQTMAAALVLGDEVASGVVVALVPDATRPAPFVPTADVVLVATAGGWARGERDDSAPVRLTSLEPAGRVVAVGEPVPVPAGADVLATVYALEAMRLVGLASGALDLTVAYAKQRRQFGRAIGSFQAIQHRLADHATAVEAARLLAHEAADPRAAYQWCGAVARAVAADAVQIHGGYGFTLEYDPQLFLRRARAWGSWIADDRDDWAAVADGLFGLPGER